MHKIMIVDNDEYIAKATMTVLKSRGYEVETATSGRDCLDRLDAYKPDLILLDIMMPGLTPTDVIADIRRRKLQAKVIYFSALKRNSETDRKIGAPLISQADDDIAIGYLEKPFTIDALLDKIQAGLAKKWQKG
jgi:CheY-like chemotaxis protein